MNTKKILIVMAVVAAMSATAAIAQTQTAAPAAAPVAATAPAVQGDSAKANSQKGRHEEKFEDRKAKALEHLAKRAADVQQKQACVQASTDKASLQACFPKRGKGKWGKHSSGTPNAGAATAPAAAATPVSK